MLNDKNSTGNNKYAYDTSKRKKHPIDFNAPKSKINQTINEWIINARDKEVSELRFLEHRTFEDIVRKNPDITEADALAFFKDADGLKISDDMFGSEEYKRYLLGVTAYDFCRKLAEDTGKEG